MTKALINFSQESLNQLNDMADQTHTSRSALIRTAVDYWLTTQQTSTIDVFGILKNKKNTVDGLIFQEKARKEWE